MELGDKATWVTGIATIILFIIGFIQIRTERNSRIKSEKKLEIRNKRKQAEYISSWFAKETFDKGGYRYWIAISNQSAQPIYNVIVGLELLDQTGKKFWGKKMGQVCLSIVPPGKGYISIQSEPPGHSRIGVEIAFNDKSGINWVRKVDGELLELDLSPIEHYKIDLPASWESLDTKLPN